MTQEQYSTLNSPAIEDLKRPFAARYHDFIRGFVYLAERAVCERIEQVDPAWQFYVLEVTHYPERNRVNVRARMTILGTTREGIGSGTYLDTSVKDYETKQVKKNDLGEVQMNYSEAEKGAATDALRRCARLFGVGRYLLDVPKHVKNDTSLSKWLHSISGDNQPPPPAKQQHTPKRSAPAPTSQPTQPEPEQEVEPGQEKEVTIQSRSTVDFKPGKPRLVFKAVTGESISVFTRKLFKDRGYCTGNDWMELEDNVPMKFTCRIKMKDSGYWEFIPGTIPAFNPGWDGLGNGRQPTLMDDQEGDLGNDSYNH